MRLVLFLALACAARAGARAPRVRAGRPPQACGDCTGIAAPAVVQFSAATGAAGKPLAAGCLCLHDAPDEAMHALNEQAVKASSQEGDVPCVSARAGSLVPVITGFHGNLGIYQLPTDKEPAARVLLSQLVAAELLDVKSNTLRKTCGTSKQRACRVWRAAAASEGLCAVLALAGGSGSNTAAETALGSLSPSFPFKGRGRRGERVVALCATKKEDHVALLKFLCAAVKLTQGATVRLDKMLQSMDNPQSCDARLTGIALPTPVATPTPKTPEV